MFFYKYYKDEPFLHIVDSSLFNRYQKNCSYWKFDKENLNAYALYVANRFRQERTNANARKVFLTSLWYLPSWLILFLLHSKVWDEEHDRDVLRDAISDAIHAIREQGRQICLHEHIVAQNPVVGEDKCPATLTRKTSVAVQNVATAALPVVTHELKNSSEVKGQSVA